MRNSHQLEKSVKNIIYGSMAADSVFTFGGGAFLIAYALNFTNNNMVLGFLGNTDWSLLAYFFSAYLIEKASWVKKISVRFLAFSRPFYLVAALLAFFPKNILTLSLLITCFIAAYLLSGVSGGTFYPWMKALIPQKYLGRFFAQRTKWMMVANLLSYGLGVSIIFLFEKLYPDKIIYAYSILLIFAFLTGCYNVYAFNQVQDVKISTREDKKFIPKVLLTLKNLPFMKLCLFLSLWNFITSFITPFFTVFMIKSLGLNTSSVIALTLISQMAYIFSANLWGKFIDSHVHEAIFTYASILFVVSILLFVSCLFVQGWLIYPILILGHIVLGYGRFAIKLGNNYTPLVYIPKKDSAIYLSLNSVYRAICAAIGGIIAGLGLSVFEKTISSNELAWCLFWLTSLILCITVLAISKAIKLKVIK